MYLIDLKDGKLDSMLKKVGVHPGSLEIFRKKAEIYPVFIPQVKASLANILKQEMLSSKGDAIVHAGTVSCRVKTTPVVLLGNISQYEDLIRKLLRQELLSLTQIAEELQKILEGLKNPVTQQVSIRGRILDYSKPQVMGILNVTQDSFYDGGKYSDVDAVLKAAAEMVNNGATILDVGGESSRPGAEVISAEEEVRRVIPVIERITSELDVVVSVDTTKASVAESAISAGAEIVNDISGLTFDPHMGDVVASTGVLLVLMHIQGTPRTMQQNPVYEDVVGEILNYFARQIHYAVECGIAMENIILDPGIGFGKTLEHNFEILRHTQTLTQFGLPVLIGASRKSMIGAVLNVEAKDRLFGTLGVHAAAYQKGASIFRVHDVKEHVEMFRLMERI